MWLLHSNVTRTPTPCIAAKQKKRFATWTEKIFPDPVFAGPLGNSYFSLLLMNCENYVWMGLSNCVQSIQRILSFLPYREFPFL